MIYFLLYILIGLGIATYFDYHFGDRAELKIRIMGFVILTFTYPIFLYLWFTGFKLNGRYH